MEANMRLHVLCRAAALFAVLFAVMLTPTFSSAQTASEVAAPTEGNPPSFDYGSNPLPGPGMYAIPFTPLIMTPIAPSPRPSLQVGASNSTSDNAAGAQNSTASVLPQDVESSPMAPKLEGASVASDIYPKK
jgi:hypothetical protein